MKRYISTGLLAGLLVSCASAPAKRDFLPIGTVAPEIAGRDLAGQPFKLSDYRGKVVVLDFWGHW